MLRACPICNTALTQASGTPTFPFCSERCRVIDLGNWLDSRYRVATGPSTTDDGDALPSEENE